MHGMLLHSSSSPETSRRYESTYSIAIKEESSIGDRLRSHFDPPRSHVISCVIFHYLLFIVGSMYCERRKTPVGPENKEFDGIEFNIARGNMPDNAAAAPS